jgi:putative transposase
VLRLVNEYRREHPEIGGRKLRYLLGKDAPELQIGRDCFFELLRENDLQIKPRRRWVRTTDSRHGLGTYSNLLGAMEVTEVHQAWVADITYIATGEGFRYLALISDAYSRKIIGYDLSASLSIEGAERALTMALKHLPEGRTPVHHSDRGVQYCSHRYIGRLRERGLSVSMAAVGDPYENAIAERINGILKQEYRLHTEFADEAAARSAVADAIWLYNTRRPHLSLGYRTPEEVYSDATATGRRAA